MNTKLSRLSGDGWDLIETICKHNGNAHSSHSYVYMNTKLSRLSGDGWAIIGTISTQLSSIILHVNYNKVHMQTADPYPCSLVLGTKKD